MIFKIYKVRILDRLGVEIAECGFYSLKEDAERRRAEVAKTIKNHAVNLLDIREINVNGPVPIDKTKKSKEKSYYDLKEKNAYRR